KQQFEGFSVSNTEGLHKGYDRFQSLLSQLEIHGASVSTEDANQDYALMACNSSDSDTEVVSCSNKCKESYANLKKLYDTQREQLSDANIEIKAYSQDLDDKIDVLTYHKKLLAEAQKEKEDLKAKVEKWHNSSKNLSKLLNTQMSANDKFGLGYGDHRYDGILSYENEVLQSVFMNKESELEKQPLYDRFVTAEGMHAVPPPMTGNYMPSGPDIEVDYSQFTYGPKQTQPSDSESQTSEFDTCESNINTEPSELVSEPVVNESNIKCQLKVWSDAPIIEEYESDSENEYVSIPTKEQETPSFANQQVKTPRETVKNQFTHSQKPKVDKKELGYGFTIRACFVCGSLNHLIRDCDFHEKRMARKAELNNGWNKKSSQRELRETWNNVQRVNKQNQFVPSAVLTRTGKIPVSTARASGTKNVSTARQSFNSQTVLTSTAMKINTVKPIVNRDRPANVFHKTHSPYSRPFKKTTVLSINFSKQKVYTAKENAVSAVGGKRETAVKPSADSSPNRLGHMTGNKAYLAKNFKSFYGGHVAFGDLQHFSISFLCHKKEQRFCLLISECLVLSPEFKLPNENQVLLKIPRQNNMYSFNLENIVPSGGLACLIAKATINESNKWHRRQEKEANEEAEALRKEYAQETENLVIQAGAAKASSTNIFSTVSTPAKANSTNPVNTVSIPISTASPHEGLSLSDPTNPEQDDSEIPPLEDIYQNSTDGIFTNSSYDDEGAVADFTNLETVVNVSPIPTSRVISSHPSALILGDPTSAVQTRSKVNKSSGAHAFVSYVQKQRRRNYLKDFQALFICLFSCLKMKPSKISEDFVKMKAGLMLCKKNCCSFKIQKSIIMDVNVPSFMAKLMRIGICLSTTRFLDPKYHQKKVYKVVKALFMGLIKAPRAWYATLSLLSLLKNGTEEEPLNSITPLHKDDKHDIFCSSLDSDEFNGRAPLSFLDLQVKQKEDVYGLLFNVLDASRPDIMFASLCLFRVSSLDLESYSNSDYAGANLDRKSTTGGCQFLGREKIILGQMPKKKKRRTIVAILLPRQHMLLVQAVVEQVLWIKSNNPVYHSKTKHIAIRHHFIRDAYEKKLIQVPVLGCFYWDDKSISCIGGLIGFRVSLSRGIDGTEALLIPTLFILWLDTVSTDSAKLVPLGKVCTAIETLKKNTAKGTKHITCQSAGKPDCGSIYEASIRSDLLFDDANGIYSLPNQAIFDAIQLMGSFHFMVKMGKISQKNVTLDLLLLVQPTQDKGVPLERPFEAQPTPSPTHHSEVPIEPQTDSSPAHPSEVPIEPQTDPSPRPSPFTIIPDSIQETSGGNLGGHSSSDKSFSGNEGEMTLQSVYDLCLSLCAQSMDAKCLLEAKIGKKEILKETMGAQRVYTLDYMETENAQDVGKTSDIVGEEKENDKDVLVNERFSTDESKVSTVRQIEGTDRQIEGTDEQIEGTVEQRKDSEIHTEEGSATQTTQPPPTSIIFGDDETIAKVLLNMSQAKAVLREKEKGVELKDIEETDRPRPTSTRSLLTLKPLPKIDPKDKGKKKIEEEDESESESDGIPEAEKKFKQLASDEEMARKIQEELEIEADRLLAEKLQEQEREQFTIEERAKVLHDTIAAQRRFLAQQSSEAIRNRPLTKNQLRNKMMTYLKHVGNFKHAELKIKKFEEVQALYEKIKRSDEDFISIGSAEDERLIKRINEKGVDSSKDEMIKESKEEVKKESKSEVQEESKEEEDDSEKENDELRLHLTIAPDKEKEDDKVEHLEEINQNVVIRSNGQKRYFSTLMRVLSIFDREDLNVVYQLVMDRYQDDIPKESEEDSTMALELIRFIKKLLAELEPEE
ncbi:ribonuclease H-like domain-containing protein, partial [Tanacetum coccineum]